MTYSLGINVLAESVRSEFEFSDMPETSPDLGKFDKFGRNMMKRALTPFLLLFQAGIDPEATDLLVMMMEEGKC